MRGIAKTGQRAVLGQYEERNNKSDREHIVWANDAGRKLVGANIARKV